MRTGWAAGAAALAMMIGLGAAEGAGLAVSSNDVRDGGTLPRIFSCDGGGVSPQLGWSGVPEEARSLAVTVFDPDAPTGAGYWHWIVANLPVMARELPRAAGNGAGLPQGAVQAANDAGFIGFAGACPPPGPRHRYIFTVYALKLGRIDLAGKRGAAAAEAIRAGSLAQASLTATYGR
jgi:Raf kinase inhibitor-like YbhB/YbcL family protein